MARALSHRRRLRTIGALLGSCLLATGCAPSAALDAGNGEKFTVVATTPILADLARNIAGEDARVQSLIPSGKVRIPLSQRYARYAMLPMPTWR